MLFDRRAKLSWSVELLTAKVAPYEFTWFELADDVPVSVQEFPTKWNVAENAPRGTIKLRVFVSAGSLFSAVGCVMGAGVHSFQLNFLVEVYEFGSSNISAYTGTLTQANDEYVVFEVTEYYGDTTKN